MSKEGKERCTVSHQGRQQGGPRVGAAVTRQQVLKVCVGGSRLLGGVAVIETKA